MNIRIILKLFWAVWLRQRVGLFMIMKFTWQKGNFHQYSFYTTITKVHCSRTVSYLKQYDCVLNFEFIDELFDCLQLWLRIAQWPTYVRTIGWNKMFARCRKIEMNLTMNFELTLEWPWMNERDWTWIIMNQTEFFELSALGQIQDVLFLNLPHVKQPG